MFLCNRKLKPCKKNNKKKAVNRGILLGLDEYSCLLLYGGGASGREGLSNVLSSELNSQNPLQLAEYLLIRHCLAALILANDLRLFVDLGRQILLSHSELLPCFHDDLRQRQVDFGDMEILRLAVNFSQFRRVHGPNRSDLLLRRNGNSGAFGGIHGTLRFESPGVGTAFADDSYGLPVAHFVDVRG